MASGEQRSTFRLLSYWNGIKEDRSIPDISQINLGEMGELWDDCFVLDVKQPDRPEFQHFGSELIQIFEQDYTGAILDEKAVHPVLADLNLFIEEVWIMESPVSHCGEFSTGEAEKLRYRSLLAPLAENGDNSIQFLIGTTNYRKY